MQRLKRQPLPAPVADDVSALAQAIQSKLIYAVGRAPENARPHDWFMATAYAVRDRLVDRWLASQRRAFERRRKRVYYLSVEFLIGRLLFDAMSNLGVVEPIRAALATLDVDLDDLRALEPDAALGNGGLGRLAACFMDSLATLGIAAYGYGIRYDYGLFRQQIRDGWQQELPEDWLANGNPWEFERPEMTYPIRFGGGTEYVGGDDETARAVWYPAEIVNAVAFDTPVAGWRGRHVNSLRLWSARAMEPIQLAAFNQGDYVGAVASRVQSEAISRVLYPGDETPAGQELRLRQEYFFTSASLQDIVRRHLFEHDSLASLPQYAAIQMNDTHPAIAVAELMRILVDDYDYSWAEAWRITTQTLSYTNHTLLPEALETWPVSLMNRLLPRHMQIIYLINWLHLKAAAEHESAAASAAAASLIDEGAEKRVRMGHLAFVGSHKVNGVSGLHTDLMRRTVFADLNRLYPDRIVNKTNGITFRRWLYQANPRLTALIEDAVGPRVLDDPSLLQGLEALAEDRGFAERVMRARRANKSDLAELIQRRASIRINPAALFDVHIKRIHEYKRQLLNVLEAVALYQAILDDPRSVDGVARVKIFAGKAAASYTQAKLIIKLASDVARVVNSDPRVGDRLKIVFLANYNVSLAEAIIPAADVSEQISTAGMEASGTGNMKLALNGALTIGTFDGANIEIHDQVGADNIFIFGMHADEVAERLRAGFSGRDAVAASPRLARAIEAVASGAFSPDDKQRFAPVIERVLGHDRFMVAADFDAYWQAQRAVDALWRNPAAWWRASIRNTARMSWFSSDRTIREYADDIWRVELP
ncbi:MAG TPA: glycogen/starch/alpha-glucan phosphorylase [Xanthobacteraceae bacterium]|nr:glycogen/starch/alpha-glucan phosphorylase [Xanthobacteraceae bacterium]